MSYPMGAIGVTGPVGPWAPGQTVSVLPGTVIYGTMPFFEPGPMIHVRLIPMIKHSDEEPVLVGWKVRVGQHDEHLWTRTFGVDEREQAVEWGIMYANKQAELPQTENVEWYRPPEPEQIPEPILPEPEEEPGERWWERFSTPKGETA